MKVTAQAKSKYTCALNFVVRPYLLAYPAAKTAAILHQSPVAVTRKDNQRSKTFCKSACLNGLAR
ncbi:hypothetical protein F4W70_03675 [Pseudomonas cannabina]|nr:hypothetical protein F4W70_03675 [Pseudomonas cannabina]